MEEALLYACWGSSLVELVFMLIFWKVDRNEFAIVKNSGYAIDPLEEGAIKVKVNLTIMVIYFFGWFAGMLVAIITHTPIASSLSILVLIANLLLFIGTYFLLYQASKEREKWFAEHPIMAGEDGKPLHETLADIEKSFMVNVVRVDRRGAKAVYLDENRGVGFLDDWIPAEGKGLIRKEGYKMGDAVRVKKGRWLVGSNMRELIPV